MMCPGKAGALKPLALEAGLALYQVVGGVMAYQAVDG
jgi:hypothetical protein